MLMATKLGRVVTYHEGLPSTKLHDPLVTQPCKIIWQTKTFISPLPQYLGTPNLAGWWKLLLIKSHYPSFMWSCGIRWKTKTLISSLPQCPWPPNLVVWWLTMRGSHSQSHMTLWSRCLERSRDELNTHLCYHNVYGYQTWQVGI